MTMTLPAIDAAPKKQATCPLCQTSMIYKGDGRYVCPKGCGEFLRSEQEQQEPASRREAHVPRPWYELVQGMPEHLVSGMVDIATLPLHTYEIGPCQGHGTKGGGGSGGRVKGPARQKADAWARKMMPGRIARSIGRG